MTRIVVHVITASVDLIVERSHLASSLSSVIYRIGILYLRNIVCSWNRARGISWCGAPQGSQGASSSSTSSQRPLATSLGPLVRPIDQMILLFFIIYDYYRILSDSSRG